MHRFEGETEEVEEVKSMKRIVKIRDTLELAFPKLKRLPRLIKSNPTKISELPEELRPVAEAFRKGMAERLGVPEEAIDENMVVKWAKHWAKSFIKPEYWEKLGLVDWKELPPVEATSP